MCLYPKLIRNKKYTSNKKNGGVIPPVTDKRVLEVPVGCGKCMECAAQKRRTWQIRLTEETKHDKRGKFITLTFSDESIRNLQKEIKGLTGYELDNEVATVAVRRFLERWRKANKKSVKHWLITELGTEKTERLHLHGIIWTDKPDEIDKHWQYGKTDVGYVNEKTVNYIVKYLSKADKIHKEYKPKMLTSAGIGKGYLTDQNIHKNKYNETNTKEYYTTRTGHKMALPIYYRNKIYTDEEREKLWLEKLDKQERWVGGERIDVSTADGETDYYKVLNYYRQKNKRLGYGDDAKNWERKQYENARRRLKHKEQKGYKN